MQIESVSPKERNAQIAAELDSVLSGLNPLVAESRAVQEEMLAFRTAYERRGTQTPLPPRSLHKIRKGTRRYLDLQRDLAGVATRTEPFAATDARELDELGVDPALREVGIATSLAAAVTLYDNYIAMLPLLGDRRFRRLVNRPDLGYGIGENELWDLVERLNGKESRKRLERLVRRWGGGPGGSLSSTDATLGNLGKSIESSSAYRHARDATLDRQLPTTIHVRRERILDRIADLGDNAMYAVSRAFGNAIGQFESRKGKLWQREDVLGHLHRVLKPLDLLLEKTPFRLTDMFIPGHFGHVAIWMGKSKELRRLRVWKREAMQEERLQHCRPLIEEGRCVLEALRSGVELNPLRVFANVDDLAVLRPTHLRRKEIRESIVRGFQQVGKEYDFNFDVETTGTIVCSELPYHVYPGVDWTTEEQLGRFTISPDHVALEALQGNADFKLVAFYHDGALVPQKEALATMQRLVTDSAS